MSSRTSESSASSSESEDEIETLIGEMYTQVQQRRRARAFFEEQRERLRARQTLQQGRPGALEAAPPPPPYSPTDQIIRELRLQNDILHETNRQNRRQSLEWYQKEIVEVLKTHKKEREEELRVRIMLFTVLGACLAFIFHQQVPDSCISTLDKANYT